MGVLILYTDQSPLVLGVQTGLCGCLTTISTFVKELLGLEGRAGYMYGVGSIVLVQVVLLSMMSVV